MSRVRDAPDGPACVTTEEIALAMGIKVRAVATHRERLYKTLGVRNQMGLADKVIVALKPMLREQ